MPRLRFLVLAVGLTAVLGVSSSAAAAPMASPVGGMVLIFGSSYHPPRLTVAPGATITVVNEEGIPHSLTAKDGSFDTRILQSGGVSYIEAPGAAGRYPYSCRVHGPRVMKGVIIVSGA